MQGAGWGIFILVSYLLIRLDFPLPGEPTNSILKFGVRGIPSNFFLISMASSIRSSFFILGS